MQNNPRKIWIAMIILMYPIVLLLISLATNSFVFGVHAPILALPSPEIIPALIVAAALLLFNHTWLMTSTELTRLKYDMSATPEEWTERGTKAEDVSAEGVSELQRRHNAHRNLTENTVYFVLLAAVFCLTSPATLAAQVWMLGFSVARLGHTYGFLRGQSGVRGLFMSVSLISLYGMASYPIVGLFL
jgi:uncharacterized membrane protein YecN with MAPEG domain